MKAANMRAQLVAQIAGQVITAWLGRNVNDTPGTILSAAVNGAESIVYEVELRLGEPIYKDRTYWSKNSQAQSKAAEQLNIDAAKEEFARVIAYWAPEWTDDPDMVEKMLKQVITAAQH